MRYLFAAESFQQAYRRSRYMAQIAEQRTRQAALIEETRATIDARLEALKEQRTEKSKLVGQQQAERQKLSSDRSGQESALKTLKKEEGRLRETQKKQEKQRRDIDSAIRKAIEAELKPKTTAAGSSKGKLDLTLTPEAKELNADFEKNRGKLPWPVEKGVITSRFGKQAHPVLPGIVIENNGVDITTEKGSSVRALFRGEVSSVIVIPGAGKAVILSHGVYRTVYSNLRETSENKPRPRTRRERHVAHGGSFLHGTAAAARQEHPAVASQRRSADGETQCHRSDCAARSYPTPPRRGSRHGAGPCRSRGGCRSESKCLGRADDRLRG